MTNEQNYKEETVTFHQLLINVSVLPLRTWPLIYMDLFVFFLDFVNVVSFL